MVRWRTFRRAPITTMRARKPLVFHIRHLGSRVTVHHNCCKRVRHAHPPPQAPRHRADLDLRLTWPGRTRTVSDPRWRRPASRCRAAVRLLSCRPNRPHRIGPADRGRLCVRWQGRVRPPGPLHRGAADIATDSRWSRSIRGDVSHRRLLRRSRRKRMPVESVVAQARDLATDAGTATGKSLMPIDFRRATDGSVEPILKSP